MTAEIDDKLMADASPRLFDPGEESHVLRLAKRFILPPFTVLDARDGRWQERKRLWAEKGLKSEDGRSARMLAKSVSDEWVVDPETGEEYQRGAPPGSVNAKILALSNGQSIFDPVLCEMAYHWFCPLGGSVLDPFAGGSVRGLIAAYLGRRYVGVDLSPSQIEANEAQAEAWARSRYYEADYRPEWVLGDSWKVLAGDDARVATEDEFDLVWTCPPYHDLEVYSDDPDDLSNMDWKDFAERYREIIAGSVDRLREHRFAGIVVGEIRAPGHGYYRNLIGETISAFEAAGAAYYNEAILITSVGTLPLRTAKQYLVSRKLGKTHQTVLWFVKGDPRKAAEACSNKDVMEAAMTAAGVSRDVDDLLATSGDEGDA